MPPESRMCPHLKPSTLYCTPASQPASQPLPCQTHPLTSEHLGVMRTVASHRSAPNALALLQMFQILGQLSKLQDAPAADPGPMGTFEQPEPGYVAPLGTTPASPSPASPPSRHSHPIRRAGASRKTWSNIYKNKQNIKYCTDEFHYLKNRINCINDLTGGPFLA